MGRSWKKVMVFLGSPVATDQWNNGSAALDPPIRPYPNQSSHRADFGCSGVHCIAVPVSDLPQTVFPAVNLCGPEDVTSRLAVD